LITCYPDDNAADHDEGAGRGDGPADRIVVVLHRQGGSMRTPARRLTRLSLALATLAAVIPIALASAGPAAATTTVTVPASTQGGVPAGVSVLNGDTIVFSASGSAGYGYEGAAPCAGYPATSPDGSRYLNGISCGPKPDPNATLSGAAIGLLIARIGGSGSWFAIGNGGTITTTGSGPLYLAYNDVPGLYGDNTGSYSVTVNDEGGGTRCSPDGCCPPNGCKCPPGGCPE
jgi:PA-IL-like protein